MMQFNVLCTIYPSPFLCGSNFPSLVDLYAICDDQENHDDHEGVETKSWGAFFLWFLSFLLYLISQYIFQVHAFLGIILKQMSLPQRDLEGKVNNARTLMDRAGGQDIHIRTCVRRSIFLGQTTTDFNQE